MHCLVIVQGLNISKPKTNKYALPSLESTPPKDTKQVFGRAYWAAASSKKAQQLHESVWQVSRS